MQAHQEKSFPATVLRMSYIYGPGAIPLDGWGGRDSLFFQMIRDGETVPVTRFGQALLHPGYVEDLGRAFGNVLESPRSVGQIYNIGGFKALEMGSYVELIARELNVEPKIEYTSIEDVLSRFPNNTNERGLRFASEHMCCSIAKAEQGIDWKPRTTLTAGLKQNITWMKQHSIV